MVARLGDLLRLTLDDVEAQEVPLWRELEFLRLYLSIEQVRFEDRLRVQIAAGSRAVRRPRAAHGAAADRRERRPPRPRSERGGGDDRREARRSANGSLALVVSDDGPGPAARPALSAGIGLTNTRTRLARLYGDGARLVVENAAPRGVRVTITLPFRTSRRGGAMRLKVLVVDDEPLAREGLKLLLGRQPQVESVSEARNGREAVAAHPRAAAGPGAARRADAADGRLRRRRRRSAPSGCQR